MTSHFSRFVLRTTDAARARAFYDAVLGRRGDSIVPLHEAALARGARPHWLGHIAVAERGGVEAVAARFVERGATRLGPGPGVGDFVILRDPGGAIVAVTDGTGPSSAGVVWHQLNTEQPERAVANYGELFGWVAAPELDLGELGRHRAFAFASGERSAGVVSDVAGRPGVHTHWLFFFSVPSLDRALEVVRAEGGLVIGPMVLPNGVRVAACDDPQGAAFGLIEPADAERLAQ
jgi:uncharacterized protein